MIKLRRFRLIPIVLAILFTSCARSCSHAPVDATQSENQDNRINLFIWGDYTSNAIFGEFERETGLKIVESNFSSNEELLAKLQAGADGYDLIIPSDYMVTVMRQLDLLEPLDFGKIPNARNVDPGLMRRDFDPKNSVSLPYSWAVTGLIYNKNKIHPPITSYASLFKRDDLKFRISLLDDNREVIGSVLKSMGQSVNSTDDSTLAAAKATLIDLKKRIREFNSSPSSMLRQGDFLAAQIFSNEALRLMQTNPEFEFVLPEDGFTMAIDNMAIPRKSRRKENAFKLINYLLQVEVNIQFSKELLAAPVVKGATARLPPSMQAQPSIGRLDLIQKHGEMLKDLGSSTAKFDRLWTEVKASSI